MDKTGYYRVGALAAMLLSLAATAGCSGKTDDVRISFCRNVTERLLDTMKPIEWTSQKAEVRREGDAAVTLGFTVTMSGGEKRAATSACFFNRTAQEASAVDHVDPLFVYATIPYAMTVESMPVPDDILKKIVRGEQLEPVVAFFDRLRREIEGMRR